MGLRADDELVDGHLRRVGTVLAAVVEAAPSKVRSFPEAQAILSAAREDQLSAVLCLLAGRFGIVPMDPSGEVMELTAAHLATNDLLDALRRRKLPWTAPTAALAARLAAGQAFDQLRMATAMKALETVIAAGAHDSDVHDALITMRDHLEATPVHIWGVTSLRVRATSAAAAMSPAGVADLSVISADDDWGPAARQSIEELEPETASRLIGLVGDLPKRPSQAWRRRAQALVEDHPVVLEVISRWMEQFLAARLVEADEAARVAGPGPMLLAAGNERAVRAAVELASFEGSTHARLLAEVALRGATTRPVPTATSALALSVAVAAIDALARIGVPGALDDLLERVERVDLIKRIGRAEPRLERQAVDRAAAVAERKRRQRPGGSA